MLTVNNFLSTFPRRKERERTRKMIRTKLHKDSEAFPLSRGSRQQAQFALCSCHLLCARWYAINIVYQLGFNKSNNIFKDQSHYLRAYCGKFIYNEGLVPNFSFLQMYPLSTILKYTFVPMLTSPKSAHISESRMQSMCYAVTCLRGGSNDIVMWHLPLTPLVRIKKPTTFFRCD